jgi:RND superfamily putative drug exporter
MKEEHDAGATAEQAVAHGLDRTGGIVSAAALCLALAMGALVLSQLVFVKELGLGVAFAVLLDATLVRAILVPALMDLMGNAAWWSPWHLSSLHETSRAVPPEPIMPGASGSTDLADPVSVK